MTTEVRLAGVRSPTKPAAAARWKSTLRIPDQDDITQAATQNRAALVTLVQMAEAEEQRPDEVVSPGDGMQAPISLTDALGVGQMQNSKDSAEVAEKFSQMKAIKLAWQAGHIMGGAFHENVLEAAVAEQLGIIALLRSVQTNLSAERAELAGWLNQRGRGELRL